MLYAMWVVLLDLQDCNMSEIKDNDVDQETIDAEYAEFIRVTREHQAERERHRKLIKIEEEDKQNEYYIDISQVDTLVHDNLVEAPLSLDQSTSAEIRQTELIRLYGGHDIYEKIRSMEMHIDDFFKEKCKETNPVYWPVIPINPKPYLNPVIR